MEPPHRNRACDMPAALSGADSERLVQALQLHQLELQMQNDELRTAHLALEVSRDLYQDLYEQAPVGFLTLSVNGTIEAVNQTGERLFGAPREHLLHRRFSDFVAVEDRDKWHITMVNGGATSEPQEHELSLLRVGCSSWLARLNCAAHGTAPATMRIVLTDLSARHAVERRLSLADRVFSHAREAIMVTAPDGTIVEVNAAFSAITGYSHNDALGMNLQALAAETGANSAYQHLWHRLEQEQHWKGTLLSRHRDGHTYVTRQTISAIIDSRGEVRNFVALFSDDTQLHEYQRQLEYIAHYDPLTRLPNRTLLARRLQQAMTDALAHGRKLAVAYLDLDGFKAINDLHGHEIGDKVLSIVARRMSKTLREACTLARLGGDEFVALIVDLDHFSDSGAMLDRLLAAASTVIHTEQLQLRLSASIGVSYFPQESEVSADQLLRQTDQAMYQAKLAGKNRLHVFDAQNDLDVRGHDAFLDRIERAVRNHELRVFYQPKVNLRTGSVVGAEALVRWLHPERGLLMPESFLPLVESNALAHTVGLWVLDHVLQQLRSWKGMGLDLPVSINVSARQLQHPDFVTTLAQRLEAFPDLERDRLMMEILETSALEDLEEVSRTLRACMSMGIRFALDDFGTGYSSLNYLKRLPVAQVKIDQTFIKDMLDSSRDIPILRAILDLAAAFGHEIIAEGVDSAAQGARLLELGCELAQGFGIAEPMPPEAFAQWVTAWERSPCWRSPSAS